MPRIIRNMLIAAVLIVLAIFAVVAMQVDDWNRDLTTNRAATSSNAKDSSLRSLELSASVDEVCEAMARFVERREDWGLGETASEGDQAVVISLIRTSRLFRFADDVRISLQPTTTGTSINITSQSRVGKGDLGQNPRNIRTLLQTLRDEFNGNSGSAGR